MGKFCSHCGSALDTDGKFCPSCGAPIAETAAEPPAEPQPPKIEPTFQQPPQQSVQPSSNPDEQDFKTQYLSFTGRLNRKRYIMRTLCVGIPNSILYGLVSTSDNDFIVLLAGLLLIPFSIACISIAVRRLHDLNRSGWFILLNFIPFINIFFSIYIIFFRGTQGPNRYGEDPLA